jgi:Kef-type K+ transport system membrane component KefB
MPHLPTLLLQICVVVGTARLFGWLFRILHQPQVIGEMVAGISLGPSLLGWIAPQPSSLLFPSESLGFLSAISQVGIVLFMFLIGLELNLSLLKKTGHTAVVTSITSIIAPFLLGFFVALYLHSELSGERVHIIHFAIFMGAAMSVTAFPVLARILIERNLFHTRVGAIAIASAAVDDVMAWCFLAVSFLLVRGGGVVTQMLFTLISLLLFVGVMLFAIRPLLRKLESHYKEKRTISQGILTLIILLVLTSALLTEWIGIHALFGAFLVGAIMPKGEEFVHELSSKFEDITIVLFLPIFFAFTGLKTTIGLLTDGNLWGYCLLIISIAIIGKLGGAMFASRATGLAWREAGAVGILLNTRGLVELIILNIGLDAGIISPTVFTIMVLMALVTTGITTPLLQLIYRAPFDASIADSQGDIRKVEPT